MAKHAAPRGDARTLQSGPTGKVRYLGRFAAPDQQTVSWASRQLGKLGDYRERDIVPLYAAATYVRQTLSEPYLNGETEWSPAEELYELAGGAQGERDRRRMREAAASLRAAKSRRVRTHAPSLSEVYERLPILSGVLIASAVVLFATKQLAGDEFTFMLLIHYITMFASSAALGAATSYVLVSSMGISAFLLGLALFGGSAWVFQTLLEPYPLPIALGLAAMSIILLVPAVNHIVRENRFNEAVDADKQSEREFIEAVRDAVSHAVSHCDQETKGMFVPNLSVTKIAMDILFEHLSLKVESGRLKSSVNKRIAHVLTDEGLCFTDAGSVSGFWLCLVETCVLLNDLELEQRKAEQARLSGKSYIPQITDSDRLFDSKLALPYLRIARMYENLARRYAERFGENDDVFAPALFWYARSQACVPKLEVGRLEEAKIPNVPYLLGQRYVKEWGIPQQRDLAFELLDWVADHPASNDQLFAIARAYYSGIRDYARLSYVLSLVDRSELDPKATEEYDYLASMVNTWKTFGVKG